MLQFGVLYFVVTRAGWFSYQRVLYQRLRAKYCEVVEVLGPLRRLPHLPGGVKNQQSVVVWVGYDRESHSVRASAHKPCVITSPPQATSHASKESAGTPRSTVHVRSYVFRHMHWLSIVALG